MSATLRQRIVAMSALLTSIVMAACSQHSTSSSTEAFTVYADYSPNAPEFGAGQPVVRAVIGGTGKYIGARGQLESMRNADGSYRQTFTLLK